MHYLGILLTAQALKTYRHQRLLPGKGNSQTKLCAMLGCVRQQHLARLVIISNIFTLTFRRAGKVRQSVVLADFCIRH